MASVGTGSLKLGKLEKFSPGSKFISQVEYDPAGRTLDITFHSGSKYRYLNVYATTFLSFKGSPTFDSYYSRGIKGNFQAVKIIDQGVGREKSAPLDQIKKERDLNEGLRERQLNEVQEFDRVWGTVNRAFAGAEE